MKENATLIKFGHPDHIKQLHNEGILYMNNLPYFWKLEKDELRGDPFDSIDEVERGKKAKITSENGSVIPINITSWTLRIGPAKQEKINIFCMYALRPSKGNFPVPEKNYKFGKYALMLTHPQEFINRISLKLKTENIKHEANLVEYYDDNYTGEVGPFLKPNRLAYQNEWRLVCYDGPEGVRKICIGSIKDISIIMLSKEINQRISVDSSGIIHWR
jgi:hypothetical protein